MILDLAKKFNDCKQRAKAAKDVLDVINKEWEGVEEALMEAMVEEGVGSMRIEGVGLVILATSTRLSLTVANKELGYQYLRESGNGGLLKEEVNAKTLGAFLDSHLTALISERIEKGLDIVDARESAVKHLNEHGFSYFTQRQVRINK